MIELNLQQATDLLGMFEGGARSVVVGYFTGGHRGPGVYARHVGYPDQERTLLGDPDTAGVGTLLLTCKVLEVGQDGPDRHGVLFRAADLSEFFIPCDKETVRLAGKHLMGDVELLFRPKP